MSEQRMEDIYRARKSKEKHGQEAQLADTVGPAKIKAAFETTVKDVRTLTGRGSFYPLGTRKALNDLLAERAGKKMISDTSHLQALLWAPTRWRVVGDPSLDFHFVERELTPGSTANGARRKWLIDKKLRLSADALLVNANDRTPIVAEIKVRGDQNAEYALIQALAAAAQLSSPKQRKRLSAVYRDHFGTTIPECVDVYVILADRPPRGTRPKLLESALKLSDELDGTLQPWVRRIRFLETVVEDGALSFKRIPKQ